MFDPTIYDNLKVVLEGGLYDLDEAGELVVTSRNDIVDLASMSRCFQMRVQRPMGQCHADVQLKSGLLDFAAELQRVRLAEQKIGAHLQITFTLPEERAVQHQGIALYLQEVFGDAEQSHEKVSVLLQKNRAGRSEAAADKNADTSQGSYRIVLTFPVKIDENNIDDVEPLLLHLVQVLVSLEKGNSF